MQPFFNAHRLPNREFPHINPIVVGRQQCSAGYTFGPVMRSYYILEYVFRGKGTYTVAGRENAVRAGQVFVIRPYESHLLRADAVDPWEYAWIGFETDLQIPEKIAEKDFFDAPMLADLFDGLITAGGEPKETAAYAVTVYEIFARLYDAEQSEPETENDPVSRAVEIIHKEYASVTVQKLADRLYLNRSYFGALFKKKLGKSPKEYIDEYRLSNAARLMDEFGYTVTQAALAAGYADAASFSRMYKRRFGISPRTFCNSRRAGKRTIPLK